MTTGRDDQTPLLVIENLHVAVDGKEILHGLDLKVNAGEVHAVMGPNGSGKSTLAATMMGHPKYEVTEGRILFKGEELLEMEPDERARRGLFLAFQYPVAVPGVVMRNFLRLIYRARHGEEAVRNFVRDLQAAMKLLKVDQMLTARYLNEGFSGGEKKRAEILQMALLKPQLAVLDETDSGLDIDALRVVAEGVNAQRGPDVGMLVITHYQRLLNFVKPDVVHVLVAGRLARTGGPELALMLEERGYDWIIQEVALAPEEREAVLAAERAGSTGGLLEAAMASEARHGH